MLKLKVVTQEEYSQLTILEMERKYGISSEQLLNSVESGKCPETINPVDLIRWLQCLGVDHNACQVSEGDLTLDDIRAAGIEIDMGEKEQSAGLASWSLSLDLFSPLLDRGFEDMVTAVGGLRGSPLLFAPLGHQVRLA